MKLVLTTGHTFSRQHRHCYLLFTQLINKHFRWDERVSAERFGHVGSQPLTACWKKKRTKKKAPAPLLIVIICLTVYL